MSIFIKPALPLRHPATWLSTWFGSGLSRRAPGTMGSLATLPFAWVIGEYYSMVGLLIFSGVALIVGTFSAGAYMKHSTRNDPPEIVIDEVAGQAALLAFMPHSLLGYVLGFALFRAFDIVKPWPISWYDRTQKGACAVMLDDIMAAFYPVLLAALAVAVGKLFGLDLSLAGWLHQ